MSLVSITGVFPNASVVGGDLTIPSGDIVSYIPSSSTSPSGAEMVYGLLETMSQAVEAAAYTNLTSSVNNTFTQNGAVVRRTYTFVVNLDFADSVYNDLNVKAEPA